MKYIALDIGNVICDFDMNLILNDVSETFNITAAEADRIFKSFHAQHDLGLTTMESQFRDRFGCQSEIVLKRLLKKWDNIIWANSFMLSMLEELLDNDFQIALLSNIGVEHAAIMPKLLAPIWDTAITHFSCEVGARKPTKLYYQSFLLQHPEFKGCLYVDDLQENLAMGRQMGFKSQHFALNSKDFLRNIQEIKEFALDLAESED